MYTKKVFVPEVTQADIDKARSDYPFLNNVKIFTLTSVHEAREKAVLDVNQSLPSQEVVSQVVSHSYSSDEKGWTITMKILD